MRWHTDIDLDKYAILCYKKPMMQSRSATKPTQLTRHAIGAEGCACMQPEGGCDLYFPLYYQVDGAGPHYHWLRGVAGGEREA
jgi:hypothetical protein